VTRRYHPPRFARHRVEKGIHGHERFMGMSGGILKQLRNTATVLQSQMTRYSSALS